MPRALDPSATIWNRLVGMVRRRTSDAVEAEDLVQEAYARLLEQSATRHIENPEGFVLKAAGNLAISELRARGRHARALADDAVAALLRPRVDNQHEVIAARARLKVVEQAIAGLPPRAREVFVLHRIEGLPYREIARRLEISVSAVEKHMARALTRLALAVDEFSRP